MANFNPIYLGTKGQVRWLHDLIFEFWFGKAGFCMNQSIYSFREERNIGRKNVTLTSCLATLLPETRR